MISLTSLLFPFSAQINITAKSGDNAILPCQDPGNDFTGVKWKRPDQDDEYIFLERDGHIAFDHIAIFTLTEFSQCFQLIPL